VDAPTRRIGAMDHRRWEASPHRLTTLFIPPMGHARGVRGAAFSDFAERQVLPVARRHP
jgi:hypothetical protein